MVGRVSFYTLVDWINSQALATSTTTQVLMQSGNMES